MAITKEVTVELRRLHAELRRITKEIANFEPVTADIPDELAAQYERATDSMVRAAHLHLGDLLDEWDRLRAAAREMLDATFENGCGPHTDVADECPICRAHVKLNAAIRAGS